MAKSKITILTSEEEFFTGNKTFQKTQDGIQKVSDYNLGTYFCWYEKTLPKGVELFSFMEFLNQMRDEVTSFRIYGEIKDFARVGDKIQRKKDFITTPALGTHLIEVDADGWQTDVKWWESKEKLREAVHTCLITLGLDFLTLYDSVIMLSQGAWPGGVLKCHIYFHSEEPILLADLRLWAKCVNARVGYKAIDYAVYGEVQPDFIAGRECTNFEDPITPEMRVMLAPGNEMILCDLSIKDGIAAEIKEVSRAADRGELTIEEGAEIDFQGDGWQMIDMAGTGGQVNEWGYRSAARIVHALGKTEVRNRINELATEMHRVAWNGLDGISGIAVRSGGQRGGREDAEVYTIDRFKQYLDSACNNQIGDALDTHLAKIRKALEQGPQALMAGDVIDSAAKLEHRWAGHYEEIRSEIASSRAVRMKAWDQAVSARGRALSRNKRVDQNEAIDAFADIENQTAVGPVIDEDGKINTLAYHNKVLETYDWFRDEQGEVGIIDRYCKKLIECGGYDLMNFTELESHLRLRTLEVMNTINPYMVPSTTAIGVISGMMSYQLRVDKEGEAVASREWGPRRVGHLRVLTDKALWINLGKEDGELRCLRVDENGKTRMSWQEAIKQHPDAPVWRHLGTPIPYGNNDPNGFVGISLGEQGIAGTEEAAWIDRLFEIIHLADDRDRVMVLAWLVSTVLDHQTRFMLQINGTKGAGKSTAAAVLCALVDPINADKPVSAHVGNVQGCASLNLNQVAMSLDGRDTAIFDNATGLNGFQQELLCTIATGLTITQNVKYLNATRDVKIRCSVIMTGINDVVTRPDLQDRVSNIEIEKREVTRQVDEAFLAHWQEISDGLLTFSMRVKSLLDGDTFTKNREGMFKACHTLYYGEDRGMRTMAVRGVEQSSGLVANDAFATCFCAWLQNDMSCWGPVGKFDGADVRVAELYDAYSRWFTGPLGGTKIWVNGAEKGDSFQAHLTNYTGDKKRALPANSNQMGRQLMKWHEDVNLFMFGNIPTQAQGSGTINYRLLDGYRTWTIKTVDDLTI